MITSSLRVKATELPVEIEQSARRHPRPLKAIFWTGLGIVLDFGAEREVWKYSAKAWRKVE